MAKRKKKTSRKKLEDALDKAWSLRVREVGHCVKCGRSEGVLNAHHIFRRSHRATRWLLANGLCLCFQCHNYGAHSKDFEKQREFHNWLQSYKGDYKLIELEQMARSIVKPSLDDLREILNVLKGEDDGFEGTTPGGGQ